MSRSSPSSYIPWGLVFLLAFSLLLLAPLTHSATGAVCPDADTTYLTLTSDCNPGSAAPECTMDVFLFRMDRTLQPPAPKGVDGGLVILSWTSQDNDIVAPHSCYIITKPDGSNTVRLNYPPGGQCRDVRAVFCPYTADPSKPANQKTMAQCAQLRDASGKTISALIWNTLDKCDSPTPVASPAAPGRPPTDLGLTYAPSQNSAQYCNPGPSSAQVTFCWTLALIFGLLFSASFVAGRNPLMFFDFGASRGVRMNRSAGAYTPMTQQVSVNPVAILSAIDRAANMASAAGDSGDSGKKDDKSKGGTGSGSKGPLGSKGPGVTFKRGGQPYTSKASMISDAGKQGLLSSFVGTQMNKLSAGAAKAIGLTPTGKGEQTTTTGAFSTMGQKAMEGMVLGALGALVTRGKGGWGGFAKTAAGHAIPSATGELSKLASKKAEDAMAAVARNEDLAKQDEIGKTEGAVKALRAMDKMGFAGYGAAAKMLESKAEKLKAERAVQFQTDKDRANILMGKIAAQYGLPSSSFQFQSSGDGAGYSIYLIKNERGEKLDEQKLVGSVSRPFGADGTIMCTYTDKSGVSWLISDVNKDIGAGFFNFNRNQVFVTNVTQGSNLSFLNTLKPYLDSTGSSRTMMLPNGQQIVLDGGANSMSGHATSIINNIGLFAEGRLNFGEVLKTILMPVMGIGTVVNNFSGSQYKPRIEDATRYVNYGNYGKNPIFIKADGVYEQKTDPATGAVTIEPVGSYNADSRIITLKSDIGDRGSEHYLMAGARYTLSPGGVLTLIDEAHPVKDISVPITTPAEASSIKLNSQGQVKLTGLGGEKVYFEGRGQEKEPSKKSFGPRADQSINLPVNLANVMSGGGKENLDFKISPMLNSKTDPSAPTELVALTHFDKARNIGIQVIAEVDKNKKPGDDGYVKEVKAIISRAALKTGMVASSEVLSISNGLGKELSGGLFKFDNNTYQVSGTFTTGIDINLKTNATQTADVSTLPISSFGLASAFIPAGTKGIQVTVNPIHDVVTGGNGKDANLVLATTLDTKTQYVVDYTNESSPKVLAIIKRDEKGHASAYSDSFTFRGTRYDINISTPVIAMGSSPSTVSFTDTRVVDGAKADSWKAKHKNQNGDMLIKVGNDTLKVHDDERHTVYNGNTPVGSAVVDKEGNVTHITFDYYDGSRVHDREKLDKKSIDAYTSFKLGDTVELVGPEHTDSKQKIMRNNTEVSVPAVTQYLTSAEFNKSAVFEPLAQAVGAGLMKANDFINPMGRLMPPSKPGGGSGWGGGWGDIALSTFYDAYVSNPLKASNFEQGLRQKKQEELDELMDESGASTYYGHRELAKEEYEREVQTWLDNGAIGDVPKLNLPMTYEDYVLQRIEAGIAPRLPTQTTPATFNPSDPLFPIPGAATDEPAPPYRRQDSNARTTPLLADKDNEFIQSHDIQDPAGSLKKLERIEQYKDDLEDRLYKSIAQTDPSIDKKQALPLYVLSGTEWGDTIPKPKWVQNIDPDLKAELDNYLENKAMIDNAVKLKDYYRQKQELAFEPKSGGAKPSAPAPKPKVREQDDLVEETGPTRILTTDELVGERVRSDLKQMDKDIDKLGESRQIGKKNKGGKT